MKKSILVLASVFSVMTAVVEAKPAQPVSNRSGGARRKKLSKKEIAILAAFATLVIGAGLTAGAFMYHKKRAGAAPLVPLNTAPHDGASPGPVQEDKQGVVTINEGSFTDAATRSAVHRLPKSTPEGMLTTPPDHLQPGGVFPGVCAKSLDLSLAPSSAQETLGRSEDTRIENAEVPLDAPSGSIAASREPERREEAVEDLTGSLDDLGNVFFQDMKGQQFTLADYIKSSPAAGLPAEQIERVSGLKLHAKPIAHALREAQFRPIMLLWLFLDSRPLALCIDASRCRYCLLLPDSESGSWCCVRDAVAVLRDPSFTGPKLIGCLTGYDIIDRLEAVPAL